MKNSVTRVPGKGIRARGTRVLGLAGMLSVLACGQQGSATQKPEAEGLRASLKFHKVQLSAQQAKDLQERGAKLEVIGDYGSFTLVQVDDKALASLPQGAEVRDELNDILLNAGAINTLSEHGQALRGLKQSTDKAAAAGKRFYLVQFAGPVKPEWYKQLESTGVKIVTYIPNNAYLVYGDDSSLSAVQGLINGKSKAAAAIQWDGEYLPDYKLHSLVQTVPSETFEVQLIKDEQANEETLSLIQRLQSKNGTIQEALGYVNVHTYLTVNDLYQIATRPDVLSVQPRPMPRKFDERQNMIVSGNLSGTQPMRGAGWLAWLTSKGFTQEQFTASGFGVDVSDSGVDTATPATPNHYGLYTTGNVNNASRLVYARIEGTPHSGGTAQGCDGHGTLNTHIIGGYSNLTGAPFADTEGYNYGMGVAPFVKFGSSVIFDPDSFTSPDYEDLQSRAYGDGMRISSNSWGASTNAYTSDAQRYDALVRDAQPTDGAVPAAGNQEMVIVFAAGNNGSGANTVGSPGTAKNIITAGASENVQAFGAPDQCNIADTGADSAMDMISFSSRGPASDGRKKPDLSAPGTHVSGGVAQAALATNPPTGNGQALSCFDASGVCAGPGTSNYFPVGQQWFTASSGTSHSTPAIAGGTALIRQYFINQGFAPPSAAMTKAYLMNSTRYMTGVGANDNLWSNSQGMGLMDLGMAFDGTPRTLADQTAANLFTATGETRVFTGAGGDPTKPFRVTLAWTDAPGSTTGGAWKNDLNLEVTFNGTTYKGNVFSGASSTTGGTADTQNNVESVFLPAGASGPFTITVTAANINSDGVPGNASALDQDFALVAYNTCGDTPAPVTDAAISIPGDNSVQIAWTDIAGATSYNVYRADTAGGPYTKLGSVARSPFVDTTVSGGSTYYYVVKSSICVEAAASNEVSITATGACTLLPRFAGLTAASNAGAATCGTNLTWAAATPACSGTMTYSVYRSTTAGFTPSVANKIATGISGTSFLDDLNLTNRTQYYYVVRATETAGAVTEEQNTVQKSATPTGAVTPGARFFDDFDSNRPPNASSYYIATASPTGTLNQTTGCHWQSSNKSYRFGAASTACSGTYPASATATLSLGGNGSTAGVNGFAIPAGVFGGQLTFNVWYSFESRYDGAWLAYSTVGAAGPWTNVGDAVSATAPYISAGGYDNTLQSNSAIRIWTGNNQGPNAGLKAVTVNLDPVAGRTVWFAYQFSTDGSVNNEGFYVDDLRVNADTIDSCTTNTPPPGPAASFRVTGLPATATAGTPVTFDVTALDAVGQTATSYTGTASFTSSDALAVLPADATFTAGQATGVSIEFRKAGPQSVTAIDTADTAIQGRGTTTVTAGAAASMVFSAQPTNTVAGASITPPVKVSLADAFGNPLTSGSTSVTVALGANPGGSTLSGTTTVTAVNGVATFSNLSLQKVATGYTLVASGDGLTGATSNPFNITAAAAAKLSIVDQPTNTVAGAKITPAVTVALLDRFDNPTTSTANVTVTLTGTPAGATLSGTTTKAAVSGVASFDDLSVNKVGTGYTLTLASTGLTSAVTSGFDITPAAPHHVLINSDRQPTDTEKNRVITPAVQATVYDRFGNVATQATAKVSVALGSNPKNAQLRGTTSVNPVSGVATFSDLSVSKEGLNYTLIVGSSGLYSDTSVGFDVTGHGNNALDQLKFHTVSDTLEAGTAFAAIEVELQDDLGNRLPDSSDVVTLSLGENTTGGQLLGTTSVAAVNGVAKFEGITLHKAGAAYSLVAKAAGYADATSSAFAVKPGAASRFEMTMPASVSAGEETTLSVTAYDAYGNVAANYSGSVKVTSSDAGAAHAATATFSEGKLSNFKVTFKSSGTKTITLTDASNASLASTSQTSVIAFGQPRAEVTSPTGGTTVEGSVNITATAAVAAGNTLTKLQILVDGAEIASGTDSTLSGTWKSDNAEAGSHIITAVATDGAGNVVTSAPVIVSVAGGCGCGATSGTDAAVYLALLVLARYMLGRRRANTAV